MQETRKNSKRIPTGKQAGIWLSIVLAIALHTLFLFLPIPVNNPESGHKETLLALQLTKRAEPSTDPTPVIAQEPPALSKPKPPLQQETRAESDSQTVSDVPKMLSDSEQAESAPTSPQKFMPYARTSFEHMNELEKQSIRSSLLLQQYIREASITEQLFGKPLKTEGSDHIAEFHLPARPDMISMLNKPVPDLPFAYQEGLVHFAYDPGVRGELQRFWDAITPEFGWRTKYGTEVRCIWVLVMGGCAWK